MWSLFRDATKHPHFTERFLIGHVAHAACVQKHDVGLRFVRYTLVATHNERMRDLFRVALIHLAAVRLNEKFRHDRARIIHGRATCAIIDFSTCRVFEFNQS